MSENRHVTFDTDLCRANPEAAADMIEELEAKLVLADRTHKVMTAEIEKFQRNLRHWREECGKLHAQLAKAHADLAAWEITAKRIDEAESGASLKPVAWRWYYNGSWYFRDRPTPRGYPSIPLYALPALSTLPELDAEMGEAGK